MPSPQFDHSAPGPPSLHAPVPADGHVFVHRHSPGVGGGERVGGGGDGEGGGGDGEGGGGDGGGGGWAATNAFSCPSIAMIKIDRIPLPWSRARTLPPAASSGDLIVFAPSTSAGPEGGLYTEQGGRNQLRG